MQCADSYLLILVELLLTLGTIYFDGLFWTLLAGLCLGYTRSAAPESSQGHYRKLDSAACALSLQYSDLCSSLRTKL